MPHPIWLFDLDNTLHHAHRHVFPIIDAEMTAWIAANLAIAPHAADELRRRYWQRYGATILGLKRHHPQLDPHHFLAAAHPLPRLLETVHPVPGLARTLRRLRGRKILFTNGSTAYGRAMLAALGVSRHFDAVVGVDALRLTPKPFAAGYRQLLARYRLDPRRCVMVEDSVDNLTTAKRLRMRTVWLRPHRRGHAAVDYLLTGLHQLPGRLGRQR
ncbi:pyrimidine 5'-nucleotidase [Chitiniphilus purpureus]|uniref:Pyrimidine 5'-nucleotidase n=1 Tax=Chitiniphilus purpureus TaxID=2981137 RepID=A0ABY6DPB8_9NEIS|nr:pyrimidine 5'-nucleotidase [Chitiniphilus sp. CD1]UXY16220.1 pyrimidine 5'-nucleotidase [Chitiniphilus sp. CD1]